MAKVKKRKLSLKKIIKFILFLIVLIAIGTGTYYYFNHDKKEKTIKVKSVDSIEGYDYTLDSNETKYYKSLFKELKKVLESDDLDESKYAELVTKLFVADFYNLDNKINKNDIGGEQFVYKDYRSDFKASATNSMYKHVENNLYGKRNQELPSVTDVSTQTPEKTSFKYGDNNDDNAFMIKFEITYDKDLDYQNKGSITLIHNDKKLEIAQLTDGSS